MSNQHKLQELLKPISRIEIIDSTGRTYVQWLKEDTVIIPQLQDNERTLKLFVTSNTKEE